MTTFDLALTYEELEYIKRVVCSGMLGGTPDVKSSVYNKIIALSKAARTAKSPDQLELAINLETDNGAEARPTSVRRIAA